MAAESKSSLCYSYKVDPKSPCGFSTSDVLLLENRSDNDIESSTHNGELETSEKSYESQEDFSEQQNLEVALNVKYSGFKSSFHMANSSSMESKKYVFRYDKIAEFKIAEEHLKGAAATAQGFADCIESSVKEEMNGLPAAQIHDKYGVVVASKVVYGGKIMKSLIIERTMKDTRNSIKASLDASYDGCFWSVGGSVSAGSTSAKWNSNQNIHTSLVARGGKVTELLSGFDGSSSTKDGETAGIKEWANSIEKSNSCPIELAAVPLYTIVHTWNEDKAAEMKADLEKSGGGTPSPGELSYVPLEIEFTTTTSLSREFIREGQQPPEDGPEIYGSLWKPQGRYWFGMVGKLSYSEYPDKPDVNALICDQEQENDKILADPIGWVKLWDDSGCGGEDRAYYRAIPRSGYVALGIVGCFVPKNKDYDQPPSSVVSGYKCVNKEYLEEIESPDYTRIWTDDSTGGDHFGALHTYDNSERGYSMCYGTGGFQTGEEEPTREAPTTSAWIIKREYFVSRGMKRKREDDESN